MPELPDLEVIKNNALKKFQGEVVNSLRSRRDIQELQAKIVGQKLAGITRRGKYMVFSFGEDQTQISCELVLHLMLHGRLSTVRTTDKHLRSEILSLSFGNGQDLRLTDRSSWAKYWLGVNGKLDKLGVEPISNDFTYEYFKQKLEKSRSKIKPLLMKQEFIAGLGNAYTDEALWRAKIHPDMIAKSLSEEQCCQLYQSIKDVLQWGIEKIKEIVGDEVWEDEKREFMNVYRKTFQPCPICSTKINQTSTGGRDTFYCPSCQEFNG